jgi:hypothetical protein
LVEKPVDGRGPADEEATADEAGTEAEGNDALTERLRVRTVEVSVEFAETETPAAGAEVELA